MCGIAGWLDVKQTSQQPDLLRAMTDSLIHRGPDGQGAYIDDRVHLGHRRLSIIDVAGGDQPIANEDNSVWVVFNGEIYNFQQLRSELLELNHQFKTHSDTETIVHAYEQYGLDFVDHLRGQFAIAIWDKKKQQLVLARDRMGQKPLYYCETKLGIIFASELKALLLHPDVKRDIDIVAFDAYLAFGYVPEPLTIFKDVKKVLPAHIITADVTGLTTHRYWQPKFTNNDRTTETDALDQLDVLLEESVRLRMISDVPVGAFLSGGIDSSLVVAYMSRVSDRPVKTFNIGFDENSHDERQFANQVAKMFSTDHHQFVIKPEAAKVIPELIQSFDEPFADSSALAVYYLAKMTREHVTVALNGDGGDESFAGYRRYNSAQKFYNYKKLPETLRKSLHLGIGAFNKLSAGRVNAANRFARWSKLDGHSMGEVYQQGVTIPVSTRNSLYSINFRAQVEKEGQFNGVTECIDQSHVEPFINRILEAEQAGYLPGDLLVKVDRMTMWHSLEGRSPFLDHKMVEFAANLNCEVKFPRGEQKNLLKKLSLRFFPKEFVYRKKWALPSLWPLGFAEN